MKERPMKGTWHQSRRKVVTFARKLQAERLVYSTAGNISMRSPGDPGRRLPCPAPPRGGYRWVHRGSGEYMGEFNLSRSFRYRCFTVWWL
jgi:ribulose-5-phosphate 4-epimerase/fuculose-1-phosphate aldolase